MNIFSLSLVFHAIVSPATIRQQWIYTYIYFLYIINPWWSIVRDPAALTHPSWRHLRFQAQRRSGDTSSKVAVGRAGYPETQLSQQSASTSASRSPRMAPVDPVFQALLEQKSDNKRALWRVENFGLVPVQRRSVWSSFSRRLHDTLLTALGVDFTLAIATFFMMKPKRGRMWVNGGEGWICGLSVFIGVKCLLYYFVVICP